ncbi:Calcium-binding lectin RapA2 [Oceanimonas sp. MB9]|nr:Calcium-binding lectin RapA2 [Oceanimonas sp. MB9]
MVIGTTATVSLTGGNLSVVAAETMIDNMSYQNNSNAPSTSNRVVTLTSVQDSGGTANGGDNTGALAVASTVTVVQNNDEPTLTSNGSHPTFTEGGAAGSLFNGTSISTVESGQTLTGFSFTVSNVTDGSSEVINLDGTAIVLTQGTSGSTAGNSLGYTVTVVGTTATVSLTGGTLSTATVQTLIDNMSYQNNSDAPDTSNRVVTLTSLQDSGGVANGGDDTASLAVASIVTVVGVNDEPALTANASHPTFTEGGAAASLFSGTSINTVESGQNVTGLSFTVTNVTDGSNERINVDGTTIVLTHGTNGSTAGNSLNYSVMVIGTTATVTLTGGNLSVVAAETMIDNMSYQNNSNAPSTSNRIVTLTSVQDSGGTANGGDNTGALAVASTVTVVQNNDEPTLTSNGSHPTFTEGGAAGSLFNGTSISTVESGQTLTGFSFTVSNVTNGSSEVINLDGTAIVLTQGTSGSTAGNSLGYTVTVVGTTATVSLTGGTLSTATVQTLIDNMSYQNNSDAPDTSNRVVTLTSLQDSGGVANGGDDTASLAVASTVTVVGVNDAPVAVDDNASAIEAGGTANGTTGSHASGNVLSNDSDVDEGDSKTVTAIRTGAEGGSGTSGTVGSVLAGQYGSLTLNADGTYSYVVDESNADVQALRQSGQTLTDTFTYTLSDTAGLTDSATLTITIDGRNDAPVAVDDSASAIEAGGTANGTTGSGASGNVLSNDTDVDEGDSKTVTAIRTGDESGSGTSGTVGQILAGQYGSLTLNADGTYSYVVDESNADVQALRQSGQTLTESFTYTLSDTAGLTDSATLTITIDGRNDAPVAVATPDNERSNFGVDYRFDVGRLFTDADGAAYGEELTIVVEGLPQGLRYDAVQGLIVGRASEPGRFTIQLTATDKAGLSVSRNYQLEILAPPEANNPVASTGQMPLPPFRMDGNRMETSTTPLPSGLVERDGERDATGFVAPQKAVDTVLLSRPGALVVKSAVAGDAAIIRAEVAVNVGANGEVVFSEVQQQAFDAVAMSVVDIRLDDGLFTLIIADGQSVAGQRYAGMQPNGEALPSWITVDPLSGEIRIRPEGRTGVLNIRIQTQGENGELRILDLQLDVQTLLRQQGADLSASAALDGGFVPLSEQLAAELEATEGYGQRLLTMLV